MSLTIIGPNDPALDALDAALAARPDLDARLRIIPWPDYRETLMSGLTADESPWQAAFVPGHIWLPELAEKGLLAPLGPMMAGASEMARAQYAAGDIISAVVAECRYAGDDYLLPLFTDGHILFYLKNVLISQIAAKFLSSPRENSLHWRPSPGPALAPRSPA